MAGVMMENGKMMMMKNGKATGPMDHEMTMTDGSMVMPDGTMKMKDGRMMTTEGKMMDGGMVIDGDKPMPGGMYMKM